MPDYIVKTGFSSQQASGAIYVIFLLFIVFLRSLAERIADYRRIQTKQAYLRAAATGSAAPKPPAPSKPGFWRRFFVSHHLPVFSSLFGTSLGTADAFELAVILAANLLLMIIPLPYPTPEQVAKGQIWSINSVSKRMAWIGCGNMFWILLSWWRAGRELFGADS